MTTSTGAAVRNLTRSTIVAADVAVARSFLARGRGLMLERAFPLGSALVIDPCSSIHMFFMRFPIDVLYMDRDDRVVRVQHRIKPWRIGPLFTRGARYVIELPAGAIESSETQVGDELQIQAT
jgi:uncharacterized membrane protein (UPF0127 family)